LFFLFVILFCSLVSNICGPNCFAVKTACADECPPFYGADPVTKVCNITASCDDRTYTSSLPLKCGDECVYDPVIEVILLYFLLLFLLVMC
jgi:hypothetical protein